MEILIGTDDDDLKLWYDLVKKHHDEYISGVTPEQDMPLRVLIQNNTSLFWDTMIAKYPYIRNKRVAYNTLDGYIFSWASVGELNQYRK